MEPKELVASLHPNATIREISAGSNRVFRVLEGDHRSTVVKVFLTTSRERRERRGLEALAGTPGVPQIIAHGIDGEQAWMEMTDAGHWNLATLPKNLTAIEEAGKVLRRVHETKAPITNLEEGIDAEYVNNHYRSTIKRLQRFRRRFGMEQAVLDRALQIEPPLATAPVTAHTHPVPTKFVVDEHGTVTLVGWEWSTLAPPEWDLTLAVWQFAKTLGEDGASAFRKGYGADLPEGRYRSWVAFHAAMLMLDAAEVREGKLGDLSYLVAELSSAVLGR